MSKEINTIKDLMNDNELSQFVTEDLEDFAEDSIVTYEIWAIGYDSNNAVTDTEMFIGEFTDPDEAIEAAKKLTLADVVHQAAAEADDTELETDIAYISLEVETVVVDEEEDSTMNIGTIYKRELWFDGESGDEEDVPEDEYSEVVPVTSRDYELLEDGSLKIACDILKNFNKNDTVQIWFTDENKEYKSILTYKIISKAEYADGNYYHLEFIY